MAEDSQFGTRFLTDPERTFEHNSWDNVALTPEDITNAQLAIEKQRDHPVQHPCLYTENPSQYWDSFYSNHTDRFFRDRHWFSHEFPELLQPNITVLEVGCGVGNSFFPLLEENPSAKVFACDFSQTAIQTLQADPRYPQLKDGIAFQHDITKEIPASTIPDHSIDVVTMIFVLSAINPSDQSKVFCNLKRILKPETGIVLYRDYGQYDLTQLRLKKDRFIQEDLYIRGDGTLVHYPTIQQVQQLVTANGFDVLSLVPDQRLLINRGKKLKMHRVWYQGKFKSPSQPNSTISELQ